MVLLDTCALLWLAADQKKLSKKAKQTIEANAGALFVSAITGFELAIKSRNHKLDLPLSPQEWFAQALSFHGIRELPVTSGIAIASVRLPLLHNDPCDRMIIATATEHSMKILTCDQAIIQYKQAKVIW